MRLSGDVTTAWGRISLSCRFPVRRSDEEQTFELVADLMTCQDRVSAIDRRVGASQFGRWKYSAVPVRLLGHRYGPRIAVASRFSLRSQHHHGRLATGAAHLVATLMFDTLNDEPAPWRRKAEVSTKP